MLNDATGFQKVYLACGYTELRLGIDGLAGLIKEHFHLDPFTQKPYFFFVGEDQIVLRD